ncbi:MAG: hypothetical protein EOP50_00260 [Sphingobacteriales bacterium]|nr:MAG: hypothetical protein EOP50_00260 [Sphingobacteriales bacterium]
MKVQHENQSPAHRGRRGHDWTPDQDNQLRENYLAMDNSKLAELVGTATFAVKKRLQDLNLYRPLGRPSKNQPKDLRPNYLDKLDQPVRFAGQASSTATTSVRAGDGTMIIVMPGQDPQQQLDLYNFRLNQKEFTAKIPRSCSRPMHIASPSK